MFPYIGLHWTNPIFELEFVNIFPVKNAKDDFVIARTLIKKLKALAKKFPAVALLGPRQSGKTTLVQAAFAKHAYVSLENSAQRNHALTDPEGFLEHYRNKHGLILDEFQRAPELLSYLQGYIDREQKFGHFILTGSQNFLMNQAITQTLAGRITIQTLLPLSVSEMVKADIVPATIEQLLFQGAYPRIYAHAVDPRDWYAAYIQTYVERDIRQIHRVADLAVFQDFVRLCAGRVGQLLNVTSLANDAGISDFTAKQWLSLLEASYILFLVRPYHKNFNKRITKAPKLYFYDTGLACSLLGIDSPEHIVPHYSRGGLFESFVISEIIKEHYNQGRIPSLYFWRDKAGREIDCIIERGTKLIPIEVKGGKTIIPAFFEHLRYWSELANIEPAQGYVVYGGHEMQRRSMGKVVSWKNIASLVGTLR